MKRRGFLASPLAAMQIAAAATGSNAKPVIAYGDGVPHEPREYAELLAKLSAEPGVQPDDFSRGGVVEQLESRIARAFGKEAAVWLPTGTLANHLAVRMLAGEKRRVLVQAESHLYCDTGDCAQALSNLNLVPLAPGKATFTLDEVEHTATASVTGRVLNPVGAIQIESPVRRRAGERFDFNEMKRISEWARRRGVGMHLDGARIFIESAYTGRPLIEYAALFDTVYVSMYKYFNATGGAVLAGPKRLLAEAFHTRRMFGGSVQQSWPMALVAMHFLDGFEARLRKAVAIGEEVITALSRDRSFEIERVTPGTNVFRLKVPDVNGPVYYGRLEAAGVHARKPDGAWLTLQVNETWAQFEPAEILARFRKAIS